VITFDEKLASLRRAEIFSATSDDVLERVAATLTPVLLPAGAPLFRKGDPGDSLYLIVEGQLRVHDGELVFNQLGQGDVVGELAVLDAAPRSASVTAIADTRLLRLGQADLYALMAHRVEVARGVIHILCGHLRARLDDQSRDFAYIRQVGQITAAAQALEAGTFAPEALDEVAERGDALGKLARVFRQMAREVDARERRLRREVQELRIEIDRARQSRQVAQITGSDYFVSLQRRAQALRSELALGDDAAPLE
jgi:CRP-like cAMP-binding protein